jgi:RNA-binding protein YhbY
MTTLNEAIRNLEVAIVKALKESDQPLSEREIVKKTGIKNISVIGWRVALSRLEVRYKKIKSVFDKGHKYVINNNND